MRVLSIDFSVNTRSYHDMISEQSGTIPFKLTHSVSGWTFGGQVSTDIRLACLCLARRSTIVYSTSLPSSLSATPDVEKSTLICCHQNLLTIKQSFVIHNEDQNSQGCVDNLQDWDWLKARIVFTRMGVARKT